MNIKEIESYLELITTTELRKFKNVFDIFYERVEFRESDLSEYDFHDDNFKYIKALFEFGIVDFFEEDDDDIRYVTLATQMEMAQIRNIFDNYIEDSGMRYIEI